MVTSSIDLGDNDGWFDATPNTNIGSKPILDWTDNDYLDIDASSKAARFYPYNSNGALDKHKGRISKNTLVSILRDKSKFASTTLFNDTLENSSMDSLWTVTSTTATTQLSSSVAILNANSTVAATTGILLASTNRFPQLFTKFLRLRSRAKLLWQGTDATCELGFGLPSSATVAVITDGAFFRVTSGVLYVGISYGINEYVVPLGVLDAGAWTNPITNNTFSVSNFYTFTILMGSGWTCFQIHQDDGDLVVEKYIFGSPLGPGVINASHANCFARVFNNTAAKAASSLQYTSFTVDLMDYTTNKSYQHTQASLQHPASIQALIYSQSTNIPNSLGPMSVVPLSDVSQSYSTLGGHYQFNAITGSEINYNMFSYQVPSPYRLYVTDVNINSYNMSATSAASGTLLEWSIDHNASTANLQTGTHNKIPIGVQFQAIGDVVGRSFRLPLTYTPINPLVTEPNNRFNVILKVPVGYSTTNQVIRGVVNITGYFE